MRFIDRSIQPATPILLVWLTLTLLFFGLTHNAFGFEDVKFVRELKAGLKRPVDVAVSLTGDVYVLDEESSKVFIFDSNGKIKLDFGRRGSNPAELSKPRSLVISPKGEIIIADTNNNRIQVFSKGGDLLFLFGNSGSKPGQFRHPSGVVVDQFGFIYVADRNNKRVQIFSPRGVFLRALRTESKPVDLGLDPQRNLSVLIPEKNKIVQYLPSDKRLRAVACVVNKRNYVRKAVGLAVDIRGGIYITEGAEHSIKKVDKNGRILLSFGSKGEGKGQFHRPAGIASDASGRIFVADSKNARVQVFALAGSKQEIIPPELTSPPVVDFDSTVPAEESIVDLFFIPGKGLYALSDQKGHILLKGPPNYLFGKPGKKQGEFKRPMAISVTKKRHRKLGIAFTKNDVFTVVKTSDDSPAMRAGILAGDIITKINGKSTENMNSEEFVREARDVPGNETTTLTVIHKGETRPIDIMIKRKRISSSRIYVADTGNNRIQILNPDGTSDFQFGKRGRKTGQFSSPEGAAVNRKGIVYVADTQNHRVQLFNNDGIFLSSFGKKGVPKKGKEPKEVFFLYPKAITIDSQNRVHILDFGNNRIQVFDEDGKFLQVIGRKGNLSGQFKEPVDLAKDENDYLYVADQGNHRIQIFDPAGRFVLAFGSSGVGPGCFQKLSAVAASSGKVFVADYKADKIQVFRFYPKGLVEEDRLYVTKTAYPPHDHKGTDAERYAIARTVALGKAVKELADKFGVSEAHLKEFIRTESEETLVDGQLRLTVSVPSKIPVEKKALAPIKKKEEGLEFELQ